MRRFSIKAVLAAAWLLAAALPASAGAEPVLSLETGGHMALIRAVVFTPDGKQLISAGDDKTIRVWDVASGQTVRILRGEIGEGGAGKIAALAISPDGKWLAAGGQMRDSIDGGHPIRLYDFATGEIVALLRGHNGMVLSLAFSPDGGLLASGSTDNTAIIWDVQTRTWLHQLKGHSADVNRVAFTLDGGGLVTGSDDRRALIWRVSDGKRLAGTAPFRGKIFGLAVSPVTGDIAVSTQEGEIAVLDDRTARVTRTIPVKGAELLNLAFSPDGRWLLTGAGAAPYQCLIFELEGPDQPLLIYRGHQHLVTAVAFSPDGRLAVTAGGRNNEIHLWDARSGALVKALEGRGASVLAVGFSSDSRQVAFGQASILRSIHDRGPLEFVLPLPGPDTHIGLLARDSMHARNFIRAAAAAGELSLAHRRGGEFGYDAELDISRNGKRIATIQRDEASGFTHNAYTFTPDGKAIIAGAGNGVLTAHGLDGAELKPNFVGHFGDVWAVAVSPDGRLLASGADDQTLRLWNAVTHELIVTLFYSKDGEWVMWTPQCYYMSSPGGDGLVGWQINRGTDKTADFIAAHQLKSHFFRPDIVEDALRRADAKAAVEAAGTTGLAVADLSSRLPPELRALSPQARAAYTSGRAIVTVAVAADDRDPVQSYTITVGGRRVPVTPAEPDPAVPQPAGGRLAAFDVPLAAGADDVRITARNTTGESLPLEYALEQSGEGALDSRGTLYILAIGIDDYSASKADVPSLNYAGADARSFEAEIRQRLGSQHAKVESRLLVSGAGGDREPVRANIAAALSLLRQAGPNDTVAVFLAGHGDNEGSDYFFIAADAAREGSKWRPDSVVSWTVLLNSLAETAGRRLLFVDTCRSANAFNFRLIKDAADADVIAFSATNQQQDALELPKLGHGVFTYTLLEGLGGAADSNRDKVVRVFELANFLAERVVELTRGAQTPDFYRRIGSMNFVLVRF